MEHILVIDNDTSATELERDYLEINSYKVTIEKAVYPGFKEPCRMILTWLSQN